MHEAYEVALSIVDGRGKNSLPAGTDGVFFDFQNAVTNKPFATPKSDTLEKTATEQSWDDFVQAPGPEPFYAVKRISETQQADADVFLMLYWMQRLSPLIEYHENRIAWLLCGQERYPQDTRFAELLMAELRQDSAACVDAMTRNFVTYISRPELRSRYLKVRWDGIGRRGSWTVLSEELEAVRPLFGLDQTEEWVRLLVTAYEIISFSTDSAGSELLQRVSDEINSFDDLQLTLSEELEAVDHWQRLRSQRSRIGTNEILKFVTQYRRSDPTETRQAVLGVISRWIDRPRVGLNLLTSTSANHPEAFWQFLHYVSIAETSGEKFDDDSLDREVADFFPDTFEDSYAGMRYRILEFCRDECVGPRQFFHHLGNVAAEIQVGNDLLDAFSEDYPLYLAIKCIYVFLHATKGDSAASIMFEPDAFA